MKYIAKTLTDSEGYDTTCHVALAGAFNLAAGTAAITIKSWKDVAAFNAGLTPKSSRDINVDLSQLTNFSAMWTELAGNIISEGVFSGGTIEDTDQP